MKGFELKNYENNIGGKNHTCSYISSLINIGKETWNGLLPSSVPPNSAFACARVSSVNMNNILALNSRMPNISFFHRKTFITTLT